MRHLPSKSAGEYFFPFSPPPSPPGIGRPKCRTLPKLVRKLLSFLKGDLFSLPSYIISCCCFPGPRFHKRTPEFFFLFPILQNGAPPRAIPGSGGGFFSWKRSSPCRTRGLVIPRWKASFPFRETPLWPSSLPPALRLVRRPFLQQAWSNSGRFYSRLDGSSLLLSPLLHCFFLPARQSSFSSRKTENLFPSSHVTLRVRPFVPRRCVSFFFRQAIKFSPRFLDEIAHAPFVVCLPGPCEGDLFP